MPEWTVDRAMNEVKAQLQEAATPLKVSPSTLKQVDARLRPSFEAQQSANANADWDQDSHKVLGLVRLAGSVAATLTFLEWAKVATVGNARPPAWPTLVRENDVLAAIHLIATQVCTSAGYCQDEQTRPSPALDTTRETFAELEQLVAKVNQMAVAV